MKRKFLTALTLGVLVSTSVACNTVKGLGRDIESVGEAGEEAISEAPSDQQDVRDAR